MTIRLRCDRISTMKVKMSIEGYGKQWIRFDEQRERCSRNLYHIALNPHYPLKDQVKQGMEQVKYNAGDKEIEFVTDPAYKHLISET